MGIKFIRWFATALILAELILANDQRQGHPPSNRTVIESEKLFANLNDLRETTRSRNRLPILKSGRNSNEKFYVEISESFLHEGQIDTMSKSEYIRNMLIALAQSAVYSGIYQHRYETYNEMRLAQGPEIDEQKCLGQLEMMANRVRQIENEGFESRDGNIYRILDTWGREMPGHLRGYLFFEGAYEDCLKARLRLDSAQEGRPGETTPMRYCVMKYRHASWGQLDQHDIIGMSMGVCIPKSCGSANTGNKFELIGEIATRHFTAAERNQTLVSALYCLPDEDSPSRSISRSPKTMLFLIGLCSWIGLVLYATYRYDKLTERLQDSNQPLDDSEQTHLALFKKLSIRNNFKSLMNVSGKGDKRKEELREREKAKEKCEDCDQYEEEQLDLSCIEGIKVIAMCYIIMGHVLMCVPTVMRNGRELADQGVYSVAFLIANLLPAFSVNSFFAITGLLTGYLVLKQNEQQRRTFIVSPSKWFAFILFRYLRIMPMYALAVLYCKTLAKYTGSGPHWDYGTSALSQRRTCEQEHWGWTLTFSSNYLSPLEHCIPGGWYLSNDFQFVLVTPLYLALLYARPQLGQLLIYASIVAGYVWGYVSIYNSHLDNFQPIANFSPSGFKTYVSHLSFNYTHPQYRIPAYLIGLLAGYKIFNLEQQRKEFKFNNKLLAPGERPQKPTWSPGFRKYGAYAISWLIFNISVAPFFGLLFPFCKQAARVLASWANPALHLHFATGITHFIMLAATGDANKWLTRFLSARHWRPLARMTLSCLLFNVEIINFIIQRQTKQMDVSNSSLMLLNLVCISACFAVAALLTCLFESPIRLVLNALIARAIERTSVKQAGIDQVRSRVASHHERPT